MHEVYQLIHQHGDLFYLITFLWTALEGETFVIFAGLAAQRGLLNIGLLFIAAWLGSFAGDQIFFLLGRLFGTRLLKHFPKLEPSVERALSWLEHYAAVFILSYRFMYGIRNISGVAIGMSRLPWQKFAIWNCAAAFIWALAYAGFGFVFGDVIAHLHHKDEVVSDSVRQATLAVLGLFFLIIAAKLATLRYHRYRAEKYAQANMVAAGRKLSDTRS